MPPGGSSQPGGSADPGGTSYSVQGQAAPECFEELHELLERVSENHPDVARQDLDMLETAVIEIAGNVVEHGRPPGQVSYSFFLEVTDTALESVLIESGTEVPADLDQPRAAPDEMSETGRGLLLAGAVLDELRYERRDGQNTWTMIRSRRS